MAPEGTVPGASDKHVMISYAWSSPSKEVMTELKRQLEERGFNVWMDVDKMKGDINDAMAEAVTNAHTVIACITKAYQESHNCKRELSLANELKKTIIPVKVDGYSQTGWLQLILAGKLWYTIPSEQRVADVLPKIIDEIILKKGAVEKSATSGSVTLPGGRSPSIKPKSDVKVTERQLGKLSRKLHPDIYTDFCLELGIEGNQSANILQTKLGNRTEATRHCLQMWKNRTCGYQDELISILRELELNDMIECIE